MSSIPASRGLSQGWRWVLGAAALTLLAALWQPLSKLLWQIVFALLLTALALPIARALEKKMTRPLAALASVAVLVLGVLGLIGLLVPHIIAQFSLVIAQAPKLMAQVQLLWDKFAQQEWVETLGLDSGAPGQWIGKAAAWLGQNLPGLISGIGTAVDGVSRAFLAPLLAYYFLRDREAFSYRLSLWIPARHRRRVLAALQEMRREAGGYVRGQLLVALAVAVLTAAGLLIVGIPAWLVLGLLMGVCELIPYVGPIIGGIPIALFSLPMGLTTVLWALGVAIAVQQLEGYFLSPHLMAGATGLHPVYILLLLSAGGLLWGLMGMVIALPAFVCVRGAARVLYETRNENVKPAPILPKTPRE